MTIRACPAGLSLLAAVLGCGCGDGGAYALWIGGDPTGEAGPAPDSDATTDAGSADPLAVSIAQESPSSCTTCVVLNARASGGTPPYAYRWVPAIADGGTARACPSVGTTYTVTVTDSSGRGGGELPTSGAVQSASVHLEPPAGCDIQDAGDAASSGATVYWADWQAADGGTVLGVVTPPSGTIQVTFTGAVSGLQLDAGDMNYFLPPSTFTSPTVPSPPGAELLEGSGLTPGTDTIAFSEPVTNPVFAIYNLGTNYAGAAASIYFNAPVTILSSGLNAGGAGYWGNEMLTMADGGTVGVSGVGANGVVEIEGTFSAIQFTNPNDSAYLSWTGFTVGVRAPR